MLVWPMIALGLGGESDAARHGFVGTHHGNYGRAASHRRAAASARFRRSFRGEIPFEDVEVNYSIRRAR